jgi:hypothetical protein
VGVVGRGDHDKVKGSLVCLEVWYNKEEVVDNGDEVMIAV